MTWTALFLWSFLAATILPVGSEPLLIGLVRDSHTVAFPVAIATVGNTLGACTLYWMGTRVGKAFATKIVAMRGGPEAVRILTRYGKPALVLSWVPVLGDLLVGLAGAARISLGSIIPWIVGGKVARYGVVAWLALSI
ncbi:MAG: DedA family protein [Acidobacteria bacterium]|nr:DedA family protein [Acidobacteriota bacterium]